MRDRWRAARLIVLAACAVGCGTTRHGGPLPTAALEASLRAEYPRATIEVLVPYGPAPPFGRYVSLVRVEPALGNLVVETPEGERALPPEFVRELRVRHRARGAATGALLGFVAAGATGAGLVYADTRGCTFECQGNGTAMVLVGLFFGAIGALVGMGVGAAFAPSTTVRFGDPPRPNE
jgi:hypothetical protein